MPNDDLDKAIQLVEQKHDEEAQVILEGLIAANTQDLTAWSWYVKSCRTPAKRLEALELCLRFNPDNPQILEAIRKLREKLSAQPQLSRNAAPVSVSLVPADDEPSPYVVTYISPEEASAMDIAAVQPNKYSGLDEVSGRPLAWYDVWRIALLNPTVEAYTALLQDPLASPMRAYGWIFLTTLVSGLVSLAHPNVIRLFNTLSTEQDSLNAGAWVAVGFVLLIPINAVLGILFTMFRAAFYGLLAQVFGGTGNFARTVYLISAFYAPYSVIVAVLSIIPCVSLLTILLSLYSFRSQVVAIQTAHRLNGGRATGVVLLPVVFLFFVICILGVIIAAQIGPLLPEIQQRLLENSG